MNTDNTSMRKDADNINIISPFRGLWHLLKHDIRGQRLVLALAYLMSLGSAAALFSAPYYLSELLDKALPARDGRLFHLYGWAILLSLISLMVFSFLKSLCLGWGSEWTFRELRGRLVATLTRKPADFFSRHETGDLLTRISNDTDALAVLFFDYIFWCFSGITMIVLFVVLMICWEWRLGLFAALSLPCYTALLAAFQGPITRAAAKAREKLSAQNDTIVDLLAGISEIRFYQQVHEADRRFMASAGTFTRANIRSLLFTEWAYNAVEIFTRLVSLAPFIVGGYLIFSGVPTLTVGTLVAYSLYMAYIAHALEVLLLGVTKLSQATPIIRRLQEILDAPEEQIRKPRDAGIIAKSTRIEYWNVSFSYVPGKPVLRDFSLSIAPGEKVALMGPSGAGKSTLLAMLIRQIKPDSGEILFGDYPIDAYSLSLYLQHFAYVRQQPYIFKTSVRDNIAAGWYHVPTDIIIATARRVRIHEAIEQLPQGYDTLLGERGLNLSTGQRQRLALARAFVRDPAILLLDEFTSALDHVTEEEILDDILLNFTKQTIICVTHSQAVARRFAKIVPIEKL